MRTLRAVDMAVVAVCTLAAAPIRGDAPTSFPLRLTAFAVNMSNVGPGGSGTLDIVIERWSTESERQTLMTAFLEKGKNSEGEGKLSVATKIVHNKKDNVIELENYASEPVRLNNIKLLK